MNDRGRLRPANANDGGVVGCTRGACAPRYQNPPCRAGAWRRRISLGDEQLGRKRFNAKTKGTAEETPINKGQFLVIEEDPQAVGNCVGQLGLASQFWFDGEGGLPFFTFSTGWARGFSRRGRARADHHVGQAEERVKLMSVFGQSAIPHFPMPE